MEFEFDDHWRGQVYRAACEGNVSRAARALIPEANIAEITPDMKAKLQALHPAPATPMPNISRSADPDLEIELDVFHQALKSFPLYTAPVGCGQPIYLKRSPVELRGLPPS